MRVFHKNLYFLIVRSKCDKLFDSHAKSATRDYTPGKFVLSKLSALVQNLMKN